MINKIFTLILSCILLTFSSCGGSNPENTLNEAESYLAQGAWENARSCCTSINDSTQYSLTPSQLCRQALIFARLAEACDNPDDMAAAAACFGHAYGLNPDSVNAFAATLDYEQRAQLRMLRDVNMGTALTSPFDFEEYPDSLYSFTDSISF